MLRNIPEAPNNNGYLHDFIVVDDNMSSSKRDNILNGIIEHDLQRLLHNIYRNDVQDGLYLKYVIIVEYKNYASQLI